MSPLSRRTLLKQLATSAAVSAATTLFPEAAFAGWKNAPGLPTDLAWKKAPCRFCGTGCGLLIGVSEGRAVAVKGDPNCSVNRGLCLREGLSLGAGALRRRIGSRTPGSARTASW